jgi:hypothetical protein
MTLTPYIDTVPGTDATVITERTTGHKDGRDLVQSTVKWPKHKPTTWPPQPTRLSPDMDEGEKDSLTRGRHQRACKGVAEGTITPEQGDRPSDGVREAPHVLAGPTVAEAPPSPAPSSVMLVWWRGSVVSLSPALLDMIATVGLQAALDLAPMERTAWQLMRAAYIDAHGEGEEGNR